MLYSAFNLLACMADCGHILGSMCSGVGLAAIQLTREAGAIPFVTASPEKHHHALSVGAEAAVDYKQGEWGRDHLSHQHPKLICVLRMGYYVV